MMNLKDNFGPAAKNSHDKCLVTNVLMVLTTNEKVLKKCFVIR